MIRPQGDSEGGTTPTPTIPPASGGGGASSGGSSASSTAAVFAQNPVTSGSVILYSVPLTQPAGGAVTRPVAYQVPAGCVVEVRPIRTNTQNVQVGIGAPEKAKYGPDLIMAAADNPTQVAVRSLDEISMFSSVTGEGITVTVRRA